MLNKSRYLANAISSLKAKQVPPPATVIRGSMLVAPEVLRSMSRANDFRNDPPMADLCRRVRFWQEYAKEPYHGYNPQVIPECVYTAVNRILMKYPDRSVGIIPQLDFKNDLDEEGFYDPEVSTPSLSGCSLRYALVHHPDDDWTLRTRIGLVDALKERKDLTCCIVMEADPCRGGYRTNRPAVVAAASALMSRTALTEVRTCITDGRFWIFGRLKAQDDGVRVYTGISPLIFEPPAEDYNVLTGPDGDRTMRSQLALVVGLLASWIDGAAPFIGVTPRRV
ncbi:hypothetical protein K466DRAFT_659643 [Polyporus arcularius HHB13444]|uniref:Uncharacterized protein n=1 Tax=Polyporus arcularius HHB13444 TaxID=1314778 RepID=A0A5C3Q0N1_9APHY|nr:hypothetical protein K466DRAFT_659643 [Polyporus arcularius HHB13444]